MMTPLLSEPLTENQLAVLKAVHGEFERAAHWPIWQYVDLSVRPAGTAEAAARTLPMVRDLGPGIGMRYGLMWWESMGTGIPHADQTVQLTVAGLYRLGLGENIICSFLKTLEYIVGRQSQLVPHPTQVQRCVIDSDELEADVFGNKVASMRFPDRLTKVKLLIEREPSLWGSVVALGAEEKWQIQVPARIASYAGVKTAEEYIGQVCAEIAPPQPPFARETVSPLSLPHMISFLDAVWTAWLRQPLFKNLDAERVARLVFPAVTADEFDSCTAALADVLARVEVPPDAGLRRKNQRPIAVLNEWLAKRLPAESAERVNRATEALGKIIDIRVGAQHTDVRRKAVEGFEYFGLIYPPLNWSQAWDTLRDSASAALGAIREEVQANRLSSQDDP